MEAVLNDYEIVSANDMPTPWRHSILYRVIKELKQSGPDFVAKLKVPDNRIAYMRKASHTYAERAGVTVSTRYADGFLWIRCSGTRPQLDLGFTRKTASVEILRDLGR